MVATKTQTRGLSDGAFESLKDRITTGLDRLTRKFDKVVHEFFLEFASEIGKCSEMQLDDLKEAIGSFGIGTRVRDVIDKSRLYGRGEMAKHIYIVGSITARTWEALPKKDRTMLNNPTKKIPLKVGNRIDHVKSSELTEKQIRRVVSAHRTQEYGDGILAPEEQNKPRRRAPDYYHVATWETDGKKILMTSVCSSHHHIKTLITKNQLTKMLADLG